MTQSTRVPHHYPQHMHHSSHPHHRRKRHKIWRYLFHHPYLIITLILFAGMAVAFALTRPSILGQVIIPNRNPPKIIYVVGETSLAETLDQKLKNQSTIRSPFAVQTTASINAPKQNSIWLVDTPPSLPLTTTPTQPQIQKFVQCDSEIYAAVNFTNPLRDISFTDLQKIIRGQITNWKQLGWVDQTIDVRLPRRQIDANHKFKPSALDALLGDNANPNLTFYDDAKAAAQELIDNASALTLLPTTQVIGNVQIRHLSIDGISPLKSELHADNYLLKLFSYLVVYPPLDNNTTQIATQFQKALNDSGYSSTSCARQVVTLSGVGDMMLSRHVGVKIRAANDNALPYRKTAAFLQQADITFGNLESPYNDQGAVITEGMVFKAEPPTIAGLKLAGFDIVDLANNHFGNQGQKGMNYTFNYLLQNNIQYYGAGKNYAEAHAVKVLKVKGYQIGFLGYDDIPPSTYAATTTTAGVAWQDADALKRDITNAKAQCDFLIVTFHWGIEYTDTPTTAQKNLARLAIDQGADMIISEHPHVVQAIEFYKQHFIAYSLGNFIFDQMFSIETEQGLIANLSLTTNTANKLTSSSIDLIPIHIYDYNQPDFTNLTETKQVLTRVFNASKL